MSEKIDQEISPSVDGDSVNRLSDEPGVKIPKQEEYDPWDLDAARNRQKKDRRVKVVTTYRVSKKPKEGAFLLVNSDPAYQIDVLLHTDKDERNMEGDTFCGLEIRRRSVGLRLGYVLSAGTSLSGNRETFHKTLCPLCEKS